MLFGRGNIIDEQSVILSETSINTKAVQNQTDEESKIIIDVTWLTDLKPQSINKLMKIQESSMIEGNTLLNISQF